MAKQFGLIVPGAKKKLAPPKANFARPSIFDESDSEDEREKIKKIGSKGPGDTQRRLARAIQEKALEEDPSIYQYDEVYDDMQAKKVEEKAASKVDRTPKYISKLMQAAAKRKVENERRIERQVQKERDAEGEQFKDKETFVTSSYKKKLEELRKAEEEEARMERLEAIGDVTKQQDLGGFYRHIYEQRMREQKEVVLPEMAGTSKDGEMGVKVKKIQKETKERSYRKRPAEDKSDEENEDEDNAKKAHLQSNLDADSDFSIDSSSDEEEEGAKKKEKSPEKETKKAEEPSQSIKEEVKSEPLPVPTTELPPEEKTPIEKPSPKEKIDIWKKRTVGEIFESAVQRYQERKAYRASNGG